MGVSKLNTVGIITAYNPDNKLLSSKENKSLNIKLLGDLEGYLTINHKGSWEGYQEEAFVVIDITKEKLIYLAEKYKQKAVIWGDSSGFEFIVDGKALQYEKFPINEVFSSNFNIPFIPEKLDN